LKEDVHVFLSTANTVSFPSETFVTTD